MLASVVLVTSWVLVLALLGVPGRGSRSGPATAGALVAQGARTLQQLTQRRHRRLDHAWLVTRPVATPERLAAPRPTPSPTGPGS